LAAWPCWQAACLVSRADEPGGTGQQTPAVGLVLLWPRARMITTRAGPQEESTGRPTGLCRLPVPWATQKRRFPAAGREAFAGACRAASAIVGRGPAGPGWARRARASCGIAGRDGRRASVLTATAAVTTDTAGSRPQAVVADRQRTLAPGKAAQRRYQAVPAGRRRLREQQGCTACSGCSSEARILAPTQRCRSPSRCGRQSIAADLG